MNRHAGQVEGASRGLARVLVPNFGPRYSGVTSVVRSTFPHLRKSIDVDLVGRPAGSVLPNRSFADVVFGGFRRPSDVPYRIWHARRNLEVVAGLFLRSVARHPLRVVFTSAAQRRHTQFTDWLIARVDAVIATTPEAAGFIRRPTVVIPHGIDCEVFRPSLQREADWAARGVGGQHGIGVFGRVRRQKGSDLFIAALLELLPRHPSFTAVVVGLAKSSEAEFLGDLKRRVEAAGLADRILFLGEQAPEELPRWLASVSICVAPQRHEGFGLVPLEAAASGTPVVAARVGAADTIIEDGKTGLLVPPDDLAALTEGMERLMNDAALRAEMGAAARDKVLREFDIEREVAGYLALYRSLWAKRRAV